MEFESIAVTRRFLGCSRSACELLNNKYTQGAQRMSNLRTIDFSNPTNQLATIDSDELVTATGGGASYPPPPTRANPFEFFAPTDYRNGAPGANYVQPTANQDGTINQGYFTVPSK